LEVLEEVHAAGLITSGPEFLLFAVARFHFKEDVKKRRRAVVLQMKEKKLITQSDIIEVMRTNSALGLPLTST